MTQRRITPESEQMIRSLFADGYRDTRAVWKKLCDAEREGELPKPLPSERTVRRILDELTAIHVTEPAGLNDLVPADARLVLDVLVEVMGATSGRVSHITRAEAGWIAKIAAAAPGLPPVAMYHVAREYVLRVLQGVTTGDLDALLAYKYWEGDAANDRYSNAVAMGWVEPPRIAGSILLIGDRMQPSPHVVGEEEGAVIDPIAKQRTARRKPRREEPKEGKGL